MKKFFKNWKWFEIVYLIVATAGLLLCFFLGSDKNIFSLCVSIVGSTSVLFVAKGLVIAPFVDIVYNVLYSILSITQRYYGEAIIYIGLMIPTSMLSIISWCRNKNAKNEDVVNINKVSLKEYIYVVITSLVATFIFYFILKALNTNELIISTISLVTSAIGSYLIFRRCSIYALLFILNDIILIIMWGLVVVKNGTEYLPTVISFCIFLINDLYGFIHWTAEYRKQNKEIDLVNIIKG